MHYLGIDLGGTNVAAAVVEDGMLLIAAVDLLLLLVAAGVFLLVKTCTLFGAFQLLLEEGDYRRGRKLEDQRNEAVSTIYWCAVTAVYLDGDAWILDNLSNAVLSHKRLSHYRPQFSVNEEYRWAHLTPSAPKKTGR